MVLILAALVLAWHFIFWPWPRSRANVGFGAQTEAEQPTKATQAQAPTEALGACAAVTQRASFPEGMIATTDYDSAPLEFLFSDQGVDVYSATSYRRPYALQWISDHGLTAIILYQDEDARQRQIDRLRKSESLPSRFGFPQHLENTKYAMVSFFGPGASFVRDLEYFEPKPCVSPDEEKLAGQLWMHYSDFQVWAMPGLHASKRGPNWVTGFESPYLIVSAKGNPIYVKIHNMMTAKVQEYMSKNPDR